MKLTNVCVASVCSDKC